MIYRCRAYFPLSRGGLKVISSPESRSRLAFGNHVLNGVFVRFLIGECRTWPVCGHGLYMCEVCKSECVENEHHFLFDCPAYAHIRYNHATLFHGIQTVSAVVNNDNPCLLGRYLRQCFEHRQSVLG